MRLNRASRALWLACLLLALAFGRGRSQENPGAAAPASPAGGNAAGSAAPIAPPSGVRARDLPNDAGHGLLVEWSLSPDDSQLLGYDVYRLPSPGAPEQDWVVVGTAAKGTTSLAYTAEEPELGGKANPAYLAIGKQAYVAVRARTPDGRLSPFSAVVSSIPKGNWFNTQMVNVFLAVLLFGYGTVYYIQRAKKGKELYIRPIPGIAAVDEAIGRATEMGKPILFVLGTGTAGDIATIAGYTILARVAKRTAEFQTRILVPVNDPVMLVMAQETTKEAYLQAGRPDVYNPESIFFISAMQFPFVAAVNGLMLREKTATNFYMGVFNAESLILAEAGNITGAIQISGTDQVMQIPFFVAATDYTLIGEELYAASAYLSQEPSLLGPLKAQDWTKIFIMAVIIVGVIIVSVTGVNVVAHLIHAV